MKKNTLTIIIAAIFILATILTSTCLFAQEKKATVSFKPTGYLALAWNGASNSEYLTFGGPGIRVDYKTYSVAFHFFPSMRYYNGDITDGTNEYRTKSQTSTILGFGPQFGYKKWAVVLPCYYIATPNAWIMSVGIGYKL